MQPNGFAYNQNQMNRPNNGYNQKNPINGNFQNFQNYPGNPNFPQQYNQNFGPNRMNPGQNINYQNPNYQNPNLIVPANLMMNQEQPQPNILANNLHRPQVAPKWSI